MSLPADCNTCRDWGKVTYPSGSANGGTITEPCPDCSGKATSKLRAKAIEEMRGELIWAMDNWPAFNSAHEGFAVLKEEVDELWDHVKTNQKRRDIEAMRKECLQVAAMAMRFALEICNEVDGRK